MTLRQVKIGVRTCGVNAQYVEGYCVAYVDINRPVVGLAPIFLIVDARHVSAGSCVEFGEIALIEECGIGDVEPSLFLNSGRHEDESIRRSVRGGGMGAVSYTHLTLPTICSV